MVWYGAFMELKEVNLGPLITNDLDRLKYLGMPITRHSAFLIMGGIVLK